MPVNDCYALQLFFAMPKQPAECIIHYRDELLGSANPQSDANDLLAQWQIANGALFMACVPDSVTLIGIKCKRVNNTGGPNVQVPLNVAGGRAGEMSTTGIAPVLTYPYTNGARWFAGRIFLPGVSEDDIAENVYDPALVVALDAYKDASILGFVGATRTWSPCIWSPTHSTWYGINTVSISGKPGIQNRRMKPTF